MTMPDDFTSLLLIDGELRPAEGNRIFPVEDPTNRTIAGHAADATEIDVDAAIAAARRAFDDTNWSTDHTTRIAALRRWKQAMHDLAEEWRARIMAEVGSTLAMSYFIHLNGPIDMLDWALDLAENFEWTEDIGVASYTGVPSRRVLLKEAAGVVAAISPWNVPLQTNLTKCGAALAAGCTVVLKPAPDTPWAGAFLGEAAHRAGLPAGVLNVVTSGDKAAAGEQLVTDPRVDVISFTGSTAVGKRIMEAAAPTLKRVLLELGGKSANIILDDAVFPEALKTGLQVCFNAGQGCTIVTRMLVPRSRYDEAIEILKGMFEAVEYGDPQSRSQVMGPLISQAQFDRVLGYIELGKQEGARLVTGGKAALPETGGYYVEPTLFADVDNSMRIAREEIFGPVLVVIPYEDEADAIRIANDSPYGLSGAVQSADVDRAMAVARKIRTGTFAVNRGGFFGPDAPFGGYKQSGLGREMGREGFAEYLQTKCVGLEA
ncbi:aldehyde dehydrogenase family protein [Mycobacterium sp. MMS18-G62]